MARLKRWMKDIFKHIGKTFGTWTDNALNELSLNDFINMPLRDFVDGVNPNKNGYSAEMQSNGEFSTANDDINMLVIGENALVNKLKPEYRGKLIFAQEGTGKTVFADNETVFDSDYLLAQILDVSPETAMFFYNTLSQKQKEVFGNKLKESIREKLQQGCTVLTARTDMLNDADIVVYNQNAELTDRRVNNQNRAINQRYSALEYHRDKLDKIKKSRNNNENKEYIELGKDDYLGSYLLSDPADAEIINQANNVLRQGSQSNGRWDLESGLTKEDLIDGFLKQFGITVNVLEDYNGQVPLFEALDKVINLQDKEQLTDAVGYAIAFMMQSDPEMIHLINMRSGYDSRIQTSRMSAAFRIIGSMDEIIRNVGADIAR